MPSKKRELIPGEIYHIYNRSAGKKTIFHSDHDYNRFLLKMCEYKEKFPIEMLAYCLMPNHFHFLVRVCEDPKGQSGASSLQKLTAASRPGDSSISPDPSGQKCRNSAQTFFHRLFTAYAKYYGAKYADDHSGRLFESSYKAKYVGDDEYYLQLCGYIHDNPVRKKLVSKPEEWPFSSYLTLVGLREDGISCDAPELREASHKQIYRDFARRRKDSLEEIMKYI
jgi:REP element-mobilizing transposase RayT